MSFDELKMEVLWSVLHVHQEFICERVTRLLEDIYGEPLGRNVAIDTLLLWFHLEVLFNTRQNVIGYHI